MKLKNLIKRLQDILQDNKDAEYYFDSNDDYATPNLVIKKPNGGVIERIDNYSILED